MTHPPDLGRYRAVLLDLDGTLLDRRGNVSARNQAAVHAAVDAGLEVYIATGRSVCATLGVHRGLGLRTPACCYNGAVLYCDATERWLSHIRLDDAAVAEIVDFCVARDLFFAVFHDDWKHALAPRRPDHEAYLALLEQVRIVPPEGIPRSGATKVSFAGEADDLALFAERFAGRPLYQERFPVRVVPGFERFSFVVVDVLSPRCRGKAEAIHFLAAERGIAADEVIAIGDHLNDLSMLRAAGLGVAMANAPEEVRRAARLVIDRHDEDGVGRFLEQVVEGRAS